MPSQSPLRDGNGPGFDLIETLRWEPALGFVRLERHLARLYSSAHELGFACDPNIVGKALGTIGGDFAQRVRLLLASDGKATVTTQPFEPLLEGETWTLRIASARLQSGDPLLRHKTTRRDIYQAARAEFQASEANDVILLNERGEVCEGTITSLFVDLGDGGPLLTPALSCGLLAGVLRGELIEQRKAREVVLMPVDIIGAKALFVGNSLRGLIPARLANH
jgi:4-amino-4-deoxychorismate lyase